MTGARPNFIKVAPLIKAINHAKSAGEDVEYKLVYAGSSNDKTLETSLFDDLQMPRPDVFLGVDSHDTIEITSRVMAKMERYLSANPCDVVIVVDDLASTMAAAIVAKKHGIKLAHLVAGTRSFDINMPKEINRLVIDGLSDFLFTAGSVMGTTANPAKIYDVGNILMDTLRQNIARFRCPQFLTDKSIVDHGYIVLTINRKALIASDDKLQAMIEAIAAKSAGLPIIAPLRKDAREKVEKICTDGIIFVEPMSYLEFGYLTSHARVIITDSGNIAEEATFNGIPCITLNNYTEHIETVKQGTNVLVNEDASLLTETLEAILAGNVKQASIPERWDGRTAERILRTLMEQIK
jgi:UDP-N-acetylglucosamine 2-epimerase (non-hydrolysing)